MESNRQGPIKVLNALWQLGTGGFEYSLVELLCQLDPERFHLDFLVTSQFEGYYDSDVRQMGARIVLGRARYGVRRNQRDLAAINRRFGPYDVIHCHRHYFGAQLLRAAQTLRIPVRIAHSHVAPSPVGSVLDRARIHHFRRTISRHCTHGLAVSGVAAASLFGDRWEEDPRFEVLPPGCNFARFDDAGSRDRVRSELNIAADEIALVHVGNFTEGSNPGFVLDIAWELDKLSPRFRVVLIGDGPLHEHIRWQVELAGLSNRVVLLDNQPDLAGLLLAMDVYLYPSRVCTFDFTAVEAQAAGLTCFLSDAVVPEVDVVPELVGRLPLELGPAAWAREVVARCQAPIGQG